MAFRIAHTFIVVSPAHLSTAEQKDMKLAAFDVQMNSARPEFHRVDRARGHSIKIARNPRVTGLRQNGGDLFVLRAR